nr:MAG TPA: type I restriction enzyme R protein [Caudoviricetes sp.]
MLLQILSTLQGDKADILFFYNGVPFTVMLFPTVFQLVDTKYLSY